VCRWQWQKSKSDLNRLFIYLHRNHVRLSNTAVLCFHGEHHGEELLVINLNPAIAVGIILLERLRDVVQHEATADKIVERDAALPLPVELANANVDELVAQTKTETQCCPSCPDRSCGKYSATELCSSIDS